MEDPLTYYRMLKEYHQYQEAVINDFNIPPYHFSSVSTSEDGIDKDPDSPFFFFNTCLPNLLQLIKQYQKRVKDLQSDIRQIEQKKEYYQTVYTQIQQENRQSKMELSRASQLEIGSSSMSVGRDATSQQNLLREYVVLLKRENKVISKQIDNFRNYLERNTPHLTDDPDEARKKNEIYLKTIVEKSKRKEERLRTKLERKERERLNKRKLLQRKKNKLEELRKLYGAKLQRHQLRLDQKKEEREELRRNLRLQENDLSQLKQDVRTLRKEKITSMELGLKENQKKELHFLEQLSSLEKKRVELNQELTNVRKKMEFYETILEEKKRFEESRNQVIHKKFKGEEKSMKKRNEQRTKKEIEDEKKDQNEIITLRKELSEKKESLKKMKKESMARRERMVTPEEEKRFEQLLEKNRELYVSKIRLSNNLKKLEKLIKKKQMKLKILQQYRHKLGRKREEEDEEVLEMEEDWGLKIKNAEKEMMKEIESVSMIRETRENEKIKEKRDKVNQLSNRLNFLRSENQRFTFAEPRDGGGGGEKNNDDEKRRTTPTILMIEHKRKREELEREREYIDGIKDRRRELNRKSSILKDELKKQKMTIDEKKFGIEVMKRRIKNSHNRSKIEDDRIRRLLQKQEELLKRKTDIQVALKFKT